MNIKGTNKGDFIVGTGAADTIEGLRGNDVFDGGAGNDTLTGDAGDHDHSIDTFVLRVGGGVDVVTDFESNDRVMFDSGTGYYDGILPPLGRLHDGQVFSNSAGTASWSVTALDYNGDGIGDTQIAMGGDAIILLGVAPDDLASGNIYGG